jgi:hypothetical protein
MPNPAGDGELQPMEVVEWDGPKTPGDCSPVLWTSTTHGCHEPCEDAREADFPVPYRAVVSSLRLWFGCGEHWKWLLFSVEGWEVS